MTTYKGNSGVAKIAAVAIAELTSFSVTETAGAVEDSSLGDAARTFVSDDLPTWTASISGHYFPGDTNGQALLVAGATLALTMNPIGTTAGLQKLTGTAIVTSIQIGETANAAIVPFTAQMQGSGALTRGVNP